MKNYVQVKGHPDLSFDTSSLQLVDNKTEKVIPMSEANKHFEVYINGKWKAVVNVIKEV